MKTNPSASTFLKKLRNSSLFLTYGDAFVIATGYRLSLRMPAEEARPEDLAVPVPVGRTFPLRLVASPLEPSGYIGAEQRNCTRGLLESFARQLGEESNRAMLEPGQADSRAVVRAKEFIAKNLGTKIHFEDVANAAGICSFQLCRVFKHDTDMTMTEFMTRQRVQRAKNLLRDPYRQIADISEQVGFTSLSQFGRSFLRFAGESPTGFRQRIKELEHCDLASEQEHWGAEHGSVGT
jgi:AraC-like DNA-binding protein